MTDNQRFTKEWLKRASDSTRKIDKGDLFLCLWIAFNGWMKSQYNEQATDSCLIEKVKTNPDLKSIFSELEKSTLHNVLGELKGFTVLNMRYPSNSSEEKVYDGTFESLIDVLYKIRCNLFHGRKNIEEDENDKKLVYLAYDILFPLFDLYNSRHGNYY